MPVAAIGGVVSGIGSLVGGILGSNASNDAAKIQAQNAQKVAGMAQTAATNAQGGVTNATGQGQGDITGGVTGANQSLANVFGGESSNLNPYLTTGSTASNLLTGAISPGGSLAQTFSFNPTDLQNDPGYQFQLNQGLDAVKRAAAATGTLGSGGTLEAMNNYAQGFAGTSYNQAYNRALSTYQTNQNTTLQNLMAGVGVGLQGTGLYNNAAQNFGNLTSNNTLAGAFGNANLGMQGATTSGQFGLQGAQIAGQALTGGANAQAAGTIGAANAWSGALGGIGNAFTGYAANRTLAKIFGGGGSATGPFVGPPMPAGGFGSESGDGGGGSEGDF